VRNLVGWSLDIPPVDEVGETVDGTDGVEAPPPAARCHPLQSICLSRYEYVEYFTYKLNTYHPSIIYIFH
jgi:hypothetical protein